MMQKKVVVTGAAGALGSAYVRALVPQGYEVVCISKSDEEIKVYKRLPKDPYEILGEDNLTNIKVHGVDLAQANAVIRRLFTGAYAVIMAAANPDPRQSKASAERNRRIDRNTLNAALDCGAEIIIYLSSMLRLAGLVDGDKIIRPDMSAPRGYYGDSKQRTVEQMQQLSKQNPGVYFLYNDHGWYPRETRGAPPTNYTDRALQSWVAETETQQHILMQLEICQNPNFVGNFHGFITVSKNIPTEKARRMGHRPFIFDIAPSEKLGIEHTANIYEMLPEYWKWRRVPIHMY